MSSESDPNKPEIHVPYNPGFSDTSQPNRFDNFLRGTRLVGVTVLVGLLAENATESNDPTVSSIECSGKRQIVAGESSGSDTFEALGQRYVVSDENIPQKLVTEEIRNMNPQLQRASDVPGSSVNLPDNCSAS